MCLKESECVYKRESVFVCVRKCVSESVYVVCEREIVLVFLRDFFKF